jgi:hypothetical protein
VRGDGAEVTPCDRMALDPSGRRGRTAGA